MDAVISIISLIWEHATGFFGAVVVGAFVISLIVALIERARLRAKSEPRGVAIITGASSGLGTAYARQIDARPDDFGVSGFWLIARNEAKLKALADSLTLPARVVPLDLTDARAADKIDEMIQKNKAEDPAFHIAMLINCAGFGKNGSTADVGRDQTRGMIAVNDTAAAALIDCALPAMAAGARILNVCSVAAFQPIPFFAAYAASKSFLLSYSRSLRVELLPRKIAVTAVCPYWIADTAFIKGAYGKARRLFMASKVEAVARRSLRAAKHRHAVSTPSFISTLDRIFCGLIPDGVLAYIMTWFL